VAIQVNTDTTLTLNGYPGAIYHVMNCGNDENRSLGMTRIGNCFWAPWASAVEGVRFLVRQIAVCANLEHVTFAPIHIQALP
jgi:hypothetical protein